MDFDWEGSVWHGDELFSRQEVEESFEDPFAVRLLPDVTEPPVRARYFNLGCSLVGKGIFSVYRTNGKLLQVIAARPFTEQEWLFYNRNMLRLLSR